MTHRYSIILPVKNGGDYLKECVQSILSQTYTGFNFIILENCSTDGSLEWLQSLEDPRIILLSVKTPLTIEENWGRITGIEKNEFITLIGHDDILDPGYLMTMDKLINDQPEASLYLSHFRYIGSSGETIRACKEMQEKYLPGDFLLQVLKCNIDISGTGYMMRSRDYDAIGGIPPYPGLLFADFELWFNLARKHSLAVATEESFAFRIHQSATSTSSDEKMLRAFERFIGFLENLKKEDNDFAKVIESSAKGFLDFYCRGMSSRLLRTPLSKRQGLTVKKMVSSFRGFASLLLPDGVYDPLKNKTVRAALIIDSNPVFRKLFLLFKKIVREPLIR